MLKILERIDLRSNSGKQELLLKELERLLVKTDERNESCKLKILRNYNIGNDFSIHLHHNIPGDEEFESDLGIRLLSSLKEFGFVNHTIWIEM